MKRLFENVLQVSEKDFLRQCSKNMEDEQKMFIVTANPEIFAKAKKEGPLRNIVTSTGTSVIADGIGIVKGGQLLGFNISERITGVDLTTHLLENVDQLGLKLYLYGAQPEVLEKLVDAIHKKYQNIDLVGYKDGFTKDQNQVAEEILMKKPDVCLVALGVPRQELFIDGLYKRAEKGVFVGVGGSFDVLSGTKKRAPQFYIRWNMEWLYRIVKEPQRIRRFFESNVTFLFLVVLEKLTGKER